MRPRDETKVERIKNKAIEMIAKEGLEGFGVNKLAAKVGLSVGTIYVYFKNKKEILTILCYEVSTRILTASTKGLEPDMDFKKGMRLQWENRYEFYRRYPMEVEFIERIRYTSIYKSIEGKLTDKYGKLLGSFIKTAEKNGQLAKMPFEVYWSLAFAPLYQLINFNINTVKGCKINKELFELTFEQVLKGLKP